MKHFLFVIIRWIISIDLAITIAFVVGYLLVEILKQLPGWMLDLLRK